MPAIEVNLREVSDEIEGITQDFLVEVASELVNHLKQEAPTGATGDLQRMTQIWQQEPGRVVITMPEHGRFVQEETSAPRPGRVIPWEPIETWARRVLGDEDAAGAVWSKLMQEGTEADPFVDRSIEATIQQFQ